MQTLSMIDAKPKAYEAIVPTRSVEPGQKSFNKLLNEKQQPPAERAEKLEPAAQGKSVAEQQPLRNEQKVARQELADKPAAPETPQDQAVMQPEVQQLVNLLNSIAAGETPAAIEQFGSIEVQLTQLQTATQPQLQQQLVDLLQTIAAGETPETIKQFGSIEAQLTQLVVQLDNRDLHGEQVLAEIDLSALVEQLQAISAGSDGEEQLPQLDEQLSSEAGLLVNAELVAASLINTNPPVATQPLLEKLVQVRQTLQKTIDVLTRQNAAPEQQVVLTEEQAAEQDLLLAETQSKIDPRFASLLTPRTENHHNAESLRERLQQNNAQPLVAGKQAQPGEQVPVAAEMQAERAAGATADLVGAVSKQPVENLLQQAQGSGQPQNQPVANVRHLPTSAPAVQLPSGQQVAESQIFDQVVTRMSGSFNGESGKMVLRLQPAELGSLKLELVIEGDKIRANLVAQSHQVQEVLERNLPQLRSALAEQGLKIDHFQVDVDQRQQQGQFDQQAGQQRDKATQRPVWPQLQATEEQLVPLAHLMQNGGAGISLRV
jgi:flagellar hook-length control protein FliK